MTEPSQDLRPWASLSANEQLALRNDYQSEIDAQPLTCSLDEKMARFTKWLAERGVAFSMNDLQRPKR